jgi:hypothetical protein
MIILKKNYKTKLNQFSINNYLLTYNRDKARYLNYKLTNIIIYFFCFNSVILM